MRRLLPSGRTSVAAFGALVALAAGGGYALASDAVKTIHACVHRRGGDLYVAKRCAKHDRKLSWNQVGPRGPAGPSGATGPQGPGATGLVYNAAGGSSSSATAIGTLGPFTFTGECTSSGGTTTGMIGVTESGARVDGIVVSGGNALSVSQNLGAESNQVYDSGSSSSSTSQTASSNELVMPTNGSAIELQQTFAVTGANSNTCHFSATATPTAVAGSAAAVRPATASAIAPAARNSGLVVAGQRIP